MTTAQAARVLGVTPSAISKMVRRGDLKPAFKLPGLRGAFLFDPEDNPQLKEGTKNGTSAA